MMSRKYSAVPPPGYAQISNANSPASRNDGFAIPLPPSQNKPPTGGMVAQPIRKRKSRFSDAPPSAAAPPPPTVLTELPTGPSKKANFGDTSQNQSSQSVSKNALVSAAAAAAAKINASLKARGKIKEPDVSLQLTSQSTASSSGTSHFNPVDSAKIRQVDDMYSTEVIINDIPIGCRNYLTRLSTQENINKSCSAYVSTRGKYMTLEDKKLKIEISGPDKPLYLYIQGQNESNVKKALDRIRQIINNHFEKKSLYQSQALAQIASLTQRGQVGNTINVPTPIPSTVAQAFEPGYPLIPTTPPSALPPSQPALPGGNFVQEKLFIGLDGLPEHFDLRLKLLGPNYRNFNFISNHTGARVILRGKGSGFVEPTSGREAFESMYAFICHPNQAGVDAAKGLVQNLIDTIKKDIPSNMLVATSLGGSNGNHYGYSGDYRNVPPPPPLPTMVPPPVPAPSNMISYPFQQSNPGQLPCTATTQDYNYANSYQNFQPTFSENTDKIDAKATGKGKPRKRFTEDTVMPPPLPPEPEKQVVRSPPLQEAVKAGSLPFWMAP